MRTKQQAMADAIKSGAVQAWVEGKPIQARHIEDGGHWGDYKSHENDHPSFSSQYYTWRIKPEPNLRPWKPEDVPTLALYRDDSWEQCCWAAIICAHSSGFEIGGPEGLETVKFNHAFENGKHSTDGGKTWHPCGVMEGGE